MSQTCDIGELGHERMSASLVDAGVDAGVDASVHAGTPSDDAYRLLAESMPQIVWTARPDGALDYVNQAMVRYSGQAAADILETSWRSLVHPDDLGPTRTRLDHARQRGEPFELEHRLRRADGVYRWFLVRGLAVREAGVIHKWFGTSTDIEDLKTAAAAREDQQKWLEAVLNLMPIPLLMIEPKTAHITFANRLAAFMTGGGMEAKEKAFADYAKRYYCTDAAGNPVVGKDLPGMRAAQGETLSNSEITWHTPAGKLALTFNSYTLSAMHGHPETILMPILDVTQLKVAEGKLQEAVRARDEFLAIAAHELRTPVTALELQLQLLRRKPDLWDKKLGLIERQVERLTVLIESLLDISRITTGRLSLELEPVNVAAVATDVVARFREQAERAGCALTLDVESELWGDWDRMRLDQVVTNLVSNAIKYGQGKPVHVTLTGDGTQARLAVRDFGIGIAPEHRERIFERFERAASSRHYGGLGLGLWIVRQVVTALGGEIEVVSRVGEGSTFVVTLPQHRESYVAAGVMTTEHATLG